ncbi:MAG: hypothetical protein QXV08_08585 [Desulfurococcus sp.]
MEDFLLILLSASVSSLEEDSGRVRVARGFFLAGLTLVLLHTAHVISANFNLYATITALVLVALLIFYAGIYAVGKFSDLINEVLLRVYLCVYTGEECEELVDKPSDPVEITLNTALGLLRGELTPLEKVLRNIRSRKLSTKQILLLFFTILIYHLSTLLSLSLLLSALLLPLGVVESAKLAFKTPLYAMGFIIVILGIILSYSTKFTAESSEVRNEQGSSVLPPLIPAEMLYRRLLTVTPRNRLERIILKLALLFFNAIPNHLKFKPETPLVVFNLYECNPALSTIINEVEKLRKHGYNVEIKGETNRIGVECDKIRTLSKFIILHDKKSPADVYRELMLVGIDNKKEGKYATKILIRECEARRTSTSENKESKPGTSKNNESKPCRLVAVIGMRAWKGCAKYYRIRQVGEKREPRLITTLEPRRVISMFVVGRRDIASIVSILMNTYLRQASIENTLCLDEEEEQGKDP